MNMQLMNPKLIYDKNFGLIYPDFDPYLEKLDPKLSKVFKRYFQGVRTLTLFRKVCEKPVALFVEPHKGCTLSCHFCYAKVWEKGSKDKLDLDNVRRLHEKFQFSNINVYGGDPLYDQKYLRELLAIFKDKPLESLTISTAGVGINQDIIDTMKGSTLKLSLQISVEPAWFGRRVTKNNKHQTTVLKLKELKSVDTFNLACVVPNKLDYWKTFNETIQDVDDIVGGKNWNCSWKFETGSGIKDLPPHLLQWFTEEFYEIESDSYTTERAYKGLASYLMDKMYMDAKPNSGKLPTAYGQCSAGWGAISIGPTGDLYTCHEGAILEEDEYKIDNLTPRGIWKTSKTHIPVLAHGCEDCEAAFFCGGGCYRNQDEAMCKFDRLRTELALKSLEKIYPGACKSIYENQKVFVEFCMRQDLSFVHSEEWDRLIKADYSFDEMTVFLKDYMGMEVKDTFDV